jgi:integrin alpha FG-GAP repeat containing protein 1
METRAISKRIPWVTVTVVAGTILLAIIVFVLHLNERVMIAVILLKNFCANLLPPPSLVTQREDELERRRVSHHINFDAL